MGREAIDHLGLCHTWRYRHTERFVDMPMDVLRSVTVRNRDSQGN